MCLTCPFLGATDNEQVDPQCLQVLLEPVVKYKHHKKNNLIAFCFEVFYIFKFASQHQTQGILQVIKFVLLS